MKKLSKVEKPKAPEDWEVSSALDTLLRAEEIKADAGLVKKVQKQLSKKYKAIKSLKDLKLAAAQMDADDMEEGEDEEESESE